MNQKKAESKMNRNVVRSYAIVAFVVGALGCNSGNIPTYKAGGKVSFPDKSPLPGGWISFLSVDTEGYSARGEIQTDGTFELTTFSRDDGAVPGRHKAMILLPVHNHRDGYPDPPILPTIDSKFGNFDTSGLEFTVSDDPSKNRFEIIITRRRSQ